MGIFMEIKEKGKNIEYFSQNKTSVLNNIQANIDEGNFDVARDSSEKYLVSNDEDLQEIHNLITQKVNEKRDKELLAENKKREKERIAKEKETLTAENTQKKPTASSEQEITESQVKRFDVASDKLNKAVELGVLKDLKHDGNYARVVVGQTFFDIDFVAKK